MFYLYLKEGLTPPKIVLLYALTAIEQCITQKVRKSSH
jgi:hypothetical protein